MSRLTFKQEQPSYFEIEVPIRDGLGNATGRSKSFRSESADAICGWYERNAWRGKPKSKKKRKKKKTKE